MFRVRVEKSGTHQLFASDSNWLDPALETRIFALCPLHMIVASGLAVTTIARWGWQSPKNGVSPQNGQFNRDKWLLYKWLTNGWNRFSIFRQTQKIWLMMAGMVQLIQLLFCSSRLTPTMGQRWTACCVHYELDIIWYNGIWMLM